MDKNIAKVNGRMIEQKHLDDMTLLYKQQTNTTEINEAERDRIIEQIIDNFLLVDEARDRKIEIGNEAIEKHIEEIKRQFGKEETFKSELEKHGVSFDMFKKNIEETLLLQKFTKDETQEKIKITADMLEGYYESHKDHMVAPDMVKARHILIGKKQAGSIEKAKKKVDDLLGKIKEGASFEEIAKEHSDCPSAEKGGDLGTFSKGKMVPEFDKAAFALKNNEVSAPVETTFGVHLIKVDEKHERKNISFKEAQSYIEKIIYQQEGQKIMKNLAIELKKKADIEIY